MVATNLYQIDPVVYASHMDMFYKLGKAHEEIEIVFHGPWRQPIDIARNNAAKLALEWECDYLAFYDDDMYFKSGEDFVNLIRKARDSNDRIHILQGLAYIRGYPFKPMCFKFDDITEGEKRISVYNDWEDHIEEDGLVKCDALGCCGTIFATKLFKMVPQPWFLTGKTHTEDIYFCVKASQFLGNLGIYIDTTVEIGHLLDKIILTRSNQKLLKSIYEEHKINQLFLPDETFVASIENSAGMIFDEKKQENPLTNLERLQYEEVKEDA
jgi:glycosyltransferase involved in cell wall biosynthesis